MPRLLAAGLGVAVLAASAAMAAPVADREPDWLRRPSSDDVIGVWPTEAWKRRQGGRATIACKVSVQGGLFDCVIATESPAGAGFGRAALLLSTQFAMKPKVVDGVPVVGEVRIPINFLFPGGSVERLPDTFGMRPVVSAAIAWEAAPTQADVVAAYPAGARAAGVGGRVTLDCRVLADRRVSGCQVLAEAPKGQGFAAAARTLTPKFTAPPMTRDGQPVRSVGVQLPFVFSPDALAAGNHPVGKPIWAGLPATEDFAAAFPQEAGTVRVGLVCSVAQGGWLVDCKVEREDPAGKGHGAASLALAPKFKVATWSTEGLPIVGGVIHVPIRYELTQAPQP